MKSLSGRQSRTRPDFAKRWVPWLCVYTGARVGELVQLRKEDFAQDASTGAWIMTLTPEAGTVKGKEFREVPLHAHLIEMGFMEFVDKAQSGYLFMTIKPGKSFPGVWQSKKNRLAEFAREYVKDPNVAPNHGWRHTFKSLGFEAGVQEKVLDAICGHAPASIGRAYGSVSLKTKVDAVGLFPRFKLEDREQAPLGQA
ncbi:tyrosine-type recombinase/integrase [Rhizobium sp. T136]|uniref:Recombinase protein, phage integrase family n=1 Tax=Rhizobium favelukesii TaxID=348824 RepID=W6RAX8_9HYPH|nr:MULTISPECIES: tyrosine-type recombinase/integrase [Rhizobium]MCS0459730.1 tyrosine-type recombinase/integrase [Rhizobium favelukesii]UFS82417.1 tyrosine-type recombinase/integrase [Rhizobium sp. T136]CDM55878.1 putative recombinase protein, phage integrase family [Rhizobium favelukesii]